MSVASSPAPPLPGGDLDYEDALAMALAVPSAQALASDDAFLEWDCQRALQWSYDRYELDRLLRELLDDGLGLLHPKLTRLWLNLVTMPNPVCGLTWIRSNPCVPEYLRGLASGTIPLTHEGLHQLESWRTAAHLRDLLMDAGALPRIDRQIMLYERWYRQRLTQIDDLEHARQLRQLTLWRLLPRLRAKAARQPLTSGSRNTAAGRFNIAAVFLTWLGTVAVASTRPLKPTSTSGTPSAATRGGSTPSSAGRWTAGACPGCSCPQSPATTAHPSARTAAWPC